MDKPLTLSSAAAVPNTSALCALSQISCGKALTNPAKAAPAPSATSTAGRTQQRSVATLDRSAVAVSAALRRNGITRPLTA